MLESRARNSWITAFDIILMLSLSMSVTSERCGEPESEQRGDGLEVVLDAVVISLIIAFAIQTLLSAPIGRQVVDRDDRAVHRRRAA
jgi:hypothetical protein